MSRVPEIDRTADALTATARRLGDQINREQAFTSRASHQLRTPLTRLQLELESGLVAEALGTAEHLSRTIDDVLALAREPLDPTSSFDVEELLTACATEWRGVFASDDRPLRLVVEDPPFAAASRTAVRQVLQVLIDNAYRHGRGVVTLTARPSGTAVAIDVADQGSGQIDLPVATPGSGGLGLSMARSIAESQGGRLLVADTEIGTRLTLLVPGAK
jgi:signal transduction histidine kinase